MAGAGRKGLPRGPSGSDLMPTLFSPSVLRRRGEQAPRARRPVGSRFSVPGGHRTVAWTMPVCQSSDAELGLCEVWSWSRDTGWRTLAVPWPKLPLAEGIRGGQTGSVRYPEAGGTGTNVEGRVTLRVQLSGGLMLPLPTKGH